MSEVKLKFVNEYGKSNLKMNQIVSITSLNIFYRIPYAKNNSIKKLWLNRSDEGKRIYLKNNFKEIENIMELYL